MYNPAPLEENMQALRLTLAQWHEVDAALCVAAAQYEIDAQLCQADGAPYIAAQFRDQGKRVRALMDLIGERKWDQ